jgi:glycosyltransferase involved in cell wall biosynthesis
MKISVIIPTYRRIPDLQRCLEALKQQDRIVDELLVVVRDTDEETSQFLAAFNLDGLPLTPIYVGVSGVIAALNAGLAKFSGDIVAITDDDAAPHQDWLAKIEAWFLSDHNIAGVGGRDRQLSAPGTRKIVGKVQWFGRVIGNHHLGVGEAREVDLLKGVNMSYRRTAIVGKQFDKRLRGTGAQVHFELEFSLALKQAGWRLIYDPQILTDHYPALRFDEDCRYNFNEIAWSNAVHNQTLSLLGYLSPLRRIAFLFWSILIGTQDAFGLVQWWRFLPSQGELATKKWLASLKGHWWGWRSWQNTPTSISAPKFFS